MDIDKFISFTLTGTAYCNGINILGKAIVMVESPDALTSTSLNVKVSLDGITYKPLLGTDGNAYTIPVVAGKSTKIEAGDFVGVPFVSFGPGSDEGANSRTFKLVVVNL